MPHLEEIQDLDAARRVIRDYSAPNAEQARTAQAILDFLDRHPTDGHRRSCMPGHLTASALLWDDRAERVLLTLHAKLNRWLQFGGHCDGDANLYGCAWRELVEESGITPVWMSPEPIDLDLHTIPARPGEPEHLHLDVRYLARAPKGAQFVCSEESHSLAWFTPDQARALELDASLERLLHLQPPT